MCCHKAFLCIVLSLFVIITKGGYTKEAVEQLLFLIKLRYGENLSGLSIIELGDQVFYGDYPSYFEPFVRYNFTEQVDDTFPAKRYFTHLGMNHTSIDWNGLNGAIKLDCREDLSKVLDTTYDIITNIGFTEHVGEEDVQSNLIRNQYAVFRNLHNFGKIGSLYFHQVPKVFHWTRHGVCDYDRIFFNELIRLNHYETLLGPTYMEAGVYATTSLVLASFIKVNDDSFMSFEDFKQLSGLRSKFDDYNIREATLSIVAADGTISSQSLKIDVTKSSVLDEAQNFCSKVVGIAFVEDCTEKVVNIIRSQRIDGKTDDELFEKQAE